MGVESVPFIMAKNVATQTFQFCADQAVQILGGMGYMRETVVERLYREVRALRIYEGATEVQQLIIGKSVLKS